VPGLLKASGRNGTAASDASKKDRATLKSAKNGQVFVAQIASERTVNPPGDLPRKIWCDSREVVRNVIPIPRFAVY